MIYADQCIEIQNLGETNMNFTTFFNHHLIVERITGNTGWVFHRTRANPEENLSLWKDGIDPTKNKSASYGKGLYATYSIKSQLNPSMASIYGKYIIRGKVDLSNFFIFDEDIFKMVRPRESYLDQYKKYGIQPGRPVQSYYNNRVDVDGRPITSGLASKYWQHIQTKGASGILFNGSTDGNVVVIYDRHAFLPSGYSNDDGKTWKSVTPDIAEIKRKKETDDHAPRKLNEDSLTMAVDNVLARNAPLPKGLLDAISTFFSDPQYYTGHDPNKVDFLNELLDRFRGPEVNDNYTKIKEVILKYINKDEYARRVVIDNCFGFLHKNRKPIWPELFPVLVTSSATITHDLFARLFEQGKLKELTKEQTDKLYASIAYDPYYMRQTINKIYYDAITNNLKLKLPDIFIDHLSSEVGDADINTEVIYYYINTHTNLPDKLVQSIVLNDYSLRGVLHEYIKEDAIKDIPKDISAESKQSKTNVVFVPGFGYERAFGKILARVEYGYNLGGKVKFTDSTFKYSAHVMKAGLAYKF